MRASRAPAAIVDSTPARARWTTGRQGSAARRSALLVSNPAPFIRSGVPETSHEAEIAGPQSTSWPATTVEDVPSTP
jgi:hypothetical protein